MYLRSIEMQGFKSFPDKTKLEFGKGISAVVGPNGSGKSNIGDAMRWVMGEKSSKSLRGKTMEDVIFSGTLHRPKSGFAQVTLTIDNTDRALKQDSDIVSVSRKLYRNGDSEYLINGEQVRLKDIDEMFMDTGLGRDGYSIIGQGKIGEIVSSKASDRRQIFEEAAGISKFRSKKEETERELLRAEDNISRLNDILGELEGRIGPLKHQCEKAKQFKILDEEKSRLEITLWVMRLSELMELQNEYKEKLELLKKQYDELSADIEKLDENIEKEFARAAEKNDESAALREKIHEIELADTKAAADSAVLKNDIEHLRERITETEQQIEAAHNSGYFLSAQLDDKNKELERIAEKAAALSEEIAAAEKDLSGADSELSEKEGELEKLGSRINELYLKRSNAAFRLETAKNNSSSAAENLEALTSDKKEQEQQRKLCEGELARIDKQTEKLLETKKEAENRIGGFTKLWEAKSSKLEQARKNYSDNDIELREINQRLGILRDLENAMEGFYNSVRFIIKAGKQGQVRGICGSVAQLISTAPEYSTAIETALGGAMQNIAVENEESAKRCIRLLKERKAGRATFLPLTSIKGKKLQDPPVDEDGYIAVASELVEHDERYKDLVSNLLGKVVIAEDIDCASYIAKKHGYRFKIVTLDGQVVNAGGSYTGGSTSKSTGILSRKNEISELEVKGGKLSENNAELKRSCEKLSQEVQKLAADLEGEREKLGNTDSELIRSEMEHKRVAELLAQLEDSDSKLQENTERFTRQIREAEEQADIAAAELAELDGEIERAEEERSKRRDENADAAEERVKLSEKLARLRIDRAELQKDEQICRTSIEQIEQNISEGEGGEEKLAADIDDYNAQIRQKELEIKEITERSAGSGDRIKSIGEQIEKAQREQAEININAEKLRTEQRNKINERETLAEEITRGSERGKSVENEFDDLAGKLWDEYGLTRSQAESSAEQPEDVKAAKSRLAELKGQIKKLGSVNLGAIEEYAEVSERYEFMNAQLEDVNKSKLELTELINSLTENMKSIFTENFEKIAVKFSSIFTELFGGGKASLSLTDPENVLECGIDINVAPPGKVVKNLLALSGGEIAFVAVCIYFAILTVRPSPFCLLDEIEAALDDVNVAKYAGYLHKFTDRTQFITITHRRGTMEEADVLYGVTMQEDGISKLLKMNMGDAKQISLG